MVAGGISFDSGPLGSGKGKASFFFQLKHLKIELTFCPFLELVHYKFIVRMTVQLPPQLMNGNIRIKQAQQKKKKNCKASFNSQKNWT